MNKTTTRRRRLLDTVAVTDTGETVAVEHISNQPVDMPVETAEEIVAGARAAIENIETLTAGIENATQDLAHWIMLRDDMLRANSDAPERLYKLAWHVTKDRKLMTEAEKVSDSQRTSYFSALVVALLGDMQKQDAKKGKDADIEAAREKYAEDRRAITAAFDLARQLATLGVWHQDFNRELSAFMLPSGAFLKENTRVESFVMRDPPAVIPLLLPSAARKAGYAQSHLIAWQVETKTFSDLFAASLSRVKQLADDKLSPKVEPAKRSPGGETNQQAQASNSATANANVTQPSTSVTVAEQMAALDKLDPNATSTDTETQWLLSQVGHHMVALLKLSKMQVVATASGSDIPMGDPKDKLNTLQDIHLLIGRWITNMQAEIAKNKRAA